MALIKRLSLCLLVGTSCFLAQTRGLRPPNDDQYQRSETKLGGHMQQFEGKPLAAPMAASGQNVSDLSWDALYKGLLQPNCLLYGSDCIPTTGSLRIQETMQHACACILQPRPNYNGTVWWLQQPLISLSCAKSCRKTTPLTILRFRIA